MVTLAPALGRLAKSAGASLIIVGGRRPGIRAVMDRFLEGSVSAVLVRSQWRPVLIVLCCTSGGGCRRNRGKYPSGPMPLGEMMWE
jgi:hypothetical protein